MPGSGQDESQQPSRAGGLVRHAALVPLSREHHGVLVQALALRRAAAAARPAAAAAVAEYLRFHDAEMTEHMADEERVVLPLARAADPEGALRIVAEHRRIEVLTAELRARQEAGGTPDTLRALGQLLDDHVRFEERVFFMRVQERLDAGQLAHLGAELERRRAERGRGPSCTLPSRT